MVLILFLLNSLGPLPVAHAQEGFLPPPGAMVHLSPEFTPAYLQGITIHPDNPLKFDFLIHQGDEALTELQKKSEYKKLVKYFLASLTVADKDQWVNLSPYEHNRIIEESFAKTEMGRDLLAQDYILKQITASLIYPEDQLGKKFWDNVYERAWKEFGTTQVPVNTFNKVWIIPDEAVVYESGNTAYVLRNHLKVMLEEDYLSMKKDMPTRGHVQERTTKSVSPSRLPSNEALQARASQGNPHSITPIASLASNIIRAIILPELEKEVNQGKNFAPLRQVYSAMILATWYKRALKESLLAKVYADRNKVSGVGFGGARGETKKELTPEEIYAQYCMAFKKGVFNYIKEDINKFAQQPIPRKYFSGGTKDFAEMVDVSKGYGLGRLLRVDNASFSLLPTNARPDKAFLDQALKTDKVVIALDEQRPDSAMTAVELMSKEEIDQFNESMVKDVPVGLGVAFIKTPTDTMIRLALNGGSTKQISGVIAATIYDRTLYVKYFNKERNIIQFAEVEGNKTYVDGRSSLDIPTRLWVPLKISQSIRVELIQLTPQRKERIFQWIQEQLSSLDEEIKEHLFESIRTRVNSVKNDYPNQELVTFGYEPSTDSVVVVLKKLNDHENPIEIYAIPSTIEGHTGHHILKQMFGDLHSIEMMRRSGFPIHLFTAEIVVMPQQSIEERLKAIQAIGRLSGFEFDFREDGIFYKDGVNLVHLSDNIFSITAFKGNLYYVMDDPETGFHWRVYRIDRQNKETVKLGYDEFSLLPETTKIELGIQQNESTQDSALIVSKPVIMGKNINPRFSGNKNVSPSFNRGGIDLTGDGFNLKIKRDGQGVPLPVSQQDLAALSSIQGFDPKILEILPAEDLPIYKDLQAHLLN